MRQVLSFLSILIIFLLVSCQDGSLQSFNNIQFNDKEVIYNGETHSIFVEGTLPYNTQVNYSKNDFVNAGTYIIEVNLSHPSYKELTLTAKLSILKAEIEGIKLESKTFIYDGSVKSLELSGKLPNGIEIKYFNNEARDVGEYLVSVILNGDNYEEIELKATMIIVSDKRDFENLSFESLIANYNGDFHNLQVTGILPTDTIITYENNNQINAGIYVVTATITSEGYNDLILNATLEILKIEFDHIYPEIHETFYDNSIKEYPFKYNMPENTNIEITYYYKNKMIEPIQANTYEVKITLKNPNYLEAELVTTLIISNEVRNKGYYKYYLQDNIIYYINNLKTKSEGNIYYYDTITKENNLLTNIVAEDFILVGTKLFFTINGEFKVFDLKYKDEPYTIINKNITEFFHYNSYIYYIDGGIDNFGKLYRMSLEDYSEFLVINENMRAVQQIDNKVYYITGKFTGGKIKAAILDNDGLASEIITITESETTFYVIHEESIYFRRLFAEFNRSKDLSKVKLLGGDFEIVLSSGFDPVSFQTYDELIYFSNSTALGPANGLYKYDKSGSNQNYLGNIMMKNPQIVEEQLYFYDSNTNRFMTISLKDDSISFIDSLGK